MSLLKFQWPALAAVAGVAALLAFQNTSAVDKEPAKKAPASKLDLTQNRRFTLINMQCGPCNYNSAIGIKRCWKIRIRIRRSTEVDKSIRSEKTKNIGIALAGSSPYCAFATQADWGDVPFRHQQPKLWIFWLHFPIRRSCPTRLPLEY